MQEHTIEIVECPNVDLIAPFPMKEIGRLRGWLYCYKSLIIDDHLNNEPGAIESTIAKTLQQPHVASWGIIDKYNATNSKHEAPLVGFISFELAGDYNGYFHVASSRVAWGRGFVEEGVQAVLPLLFQAIPTLQRVSASVLDKNKPAKSLAYRLGFTKEGRFEAFTRQNGQPMAVAHFGLTKAAWEELCRQSEIGLNHSDRLELPSSLELGGSLVQESELSEVEASKVA